MKRIYAFLTIFLLGFICHSPAASAADADKQQPVSIRSNSQSNLTEINRQLQEIIRMNDAIKASQATKIAELQRIQEQAKIHQKILNNLVMSKATAPVVRPSDVDEVLRQEKIRLIREQASRNAEIVKAIERKKRS